MTKRTLSSSQKPRKPSADIVAALFNTSPDVVDMLRQALEQAGIVVVSAFTHEIRDGAVNVDAFVRQHDPKVIVYDIAPPYDANWQLFQHVSRMEAISGRQIVITSVNPARVEQLAGRQQQIYEIVGKPLDLSRLVRAVKEAGRARAIR
jgi:DNA-binding response OmpR family regulator